MHYTVGHVFCEPPQDVDDLIYGDAVTVPSERAVCFALGA